MIIEVASKFEGMFIIAPSSIIKRKRKKIDVIEKIYTVYSLSSDVGDDVKQRLPETQKPHLKVKTGHHKENHRVSWGNLSRNSNNARKTIEGLKRNANW